MFYREVNMIFNNLFNLAIIKNRLLRRFLKLLVLIFLFPVITSKWLTLKLKIHFTKNYIFNIKTARGHFQFYFPYIKTDHIQRVILFSNSFYEEQSLKKVERLFFKKSMRILDIGANIVNHAIYYASSNNVSEVICFEPVSKTYEILLKNVRINNLSNKIRAYNLGLSDETGKASVVDYNLLNIGGTHITKNNNGIINLKKIDDIDLASIDFMKIDVEGFELNVLKGAIKTLIKYSPLIQIEIFKENHNLVTNYLDSLNYKVEYVIDHSNFIFKRN